MNLYFFDRNRLFTFVVAISRDKRGMHHDSSTET
jgi:hypothetical protein